jgi:hypothetical protein
MVAVDELLFYDILRFRQYKFRIEGQIAIEHLVQTEFIILKLIYTAIFTHNS